MGDGGSPWSNLSLLSPYSTVACRYIPLSGIHGEAVEVHLAGALVWLLVLRMLVVVLLLLIQVCWRPCCSQGLYTNTQLYHHSRPQGCGSANVGPFQTQHSEVKGSVGLETVRAVLGGDNMGMFSSVLCHSVTWPLRAP